MLHGTTEVIGICFIHAARNAETIRLKLLVVRKPLVVRHVTKLHVVVAHVSYNAHVQYSI